MTPPAAFSETTLTSTLGSTAPRAGGCEAHCIAAYGHDFRPAYAQLSCVRDALAGVPIIALTATATPTVRDEIVQALQLRTPEVTAAHFESVLRTARPSVGKDDHARFDQFTKEFGSG